MRAQRFPGGLRAAMNSLPPDPQSRGLAVAYSGGSLGAILAPAVIVPIALRFGWRAAFLFSGSLGVLWLGMWSGVAIGRRNGRCAPFPPRGGRICGRDHRRHRRPRTRGDATGERRLLIDQKNSANTAAPEAVYGMAAKGRAQIASRKNIPTGRAPLAKRSSAQPQKK
ncbi:MAG TPA: MFS transporter [Bryobacteraceae bacterium]|nr:MFS transporter [Bryobacteraceae bacterium]